MNDLERMKIKRDIANVLAAKTNMECTIMERMEEIKRLESQIKIQEDTLSKLHAKLEGNINE